jgi:hypothetical protein
VDQAELLSYLLDVLEGGHFRYGITGSHATMAYGESRFTNDIDVVMELDAASLERLRAAFSFPDFYMNEGATIAVANGGMFNIVRPDSGLKIDVIVPEKEFDRQQLDRVVRAPVNLAGRMASFISPEDVIIKKMAAYNEGESDKHLRDITGVLTSLASRIDRTYIERWADQLGYRHIWDAIVARVGG